MAYELKLSDLPPEDHNQSYELRLSDLPSETNEEDPRLKQMKYVTGSDRTALDTVRDVVGGAIGGLGKGGQAIASLATGGRAPQVDFDELTSAIRSPNKSIGGNVATGIGEYLPYAMAGGSSLAGQLGAGAAFGAATTEPGESNLFGFLPSGKLGGAIESALLNMLTHGAAKGLEALRPSKLLRGQLSPEELQNNLDVTKDSMTPLGDVIQSPSMKRAYENYLPQIPLSGGYDSMLENASQIRNTGEDLVKSIGGDLTSENQGTELKNALKKAADEARVEKNENYAKPNKIADDLKLTIGRDNLSSKAQQAIEEIEKSPELKRKFDKKLLEDLKEYANNKTGNSLKLSNIFKGTLGEDANEFYQNGRMHEFGIAKDMQKALEEDINNGIEASGSDELKNAHSSAQKNYAEKFAPFDDPDIVKFTRRGGDQDLLLSHFIKKGGNDRGYLLSKLMSKLDGKHSDLPLKMYISGAMENGKLNPLKLRSLYESLGDNQKSVLVKDEGLRKSLQNYVDLVGKNTESFNAMLNPKTGQRDLDSTIKTVLAAGGYGLGGIPGAIAGLIGPGLVSRQVTKAITSPSIRESLVKSMIENKPKFNTPAKRKSAEILTQSIADVMNRKQ